MSGALCGLWIDRDGRVHVSTAQPDGGRVESVTALRPFAWLGAAAGSEAETPPGVSVEPLQGAGVFTRLVHADTAALLDGFVKALPTGVPVDAVKPVESQYLLQTRSRLFADLSYRALRRCQLDIETGSTDGAFSDATKPADRVLAVGLRCGEREHLLTLEAPTDEAERALLVRFGEVLRAEDPDTIEGHNLFKFDLDYLRVRCRRHKVACTWGRFGQGATFRNSRLKVAERWIDFPRCDLPGRAVIDTFLLVQLYDISTRELTSYGLKEVARYFGVTDEDAGETGARTYLGGADIQRAFNEDRGRFLSYLSDDLRETRGVADVLLPTYVEQVRTFPITLQEATLRGTTGKVDLLFLEAYYHGRQACPAPPEVAPFEGGFTRSFAEGVFRQVLHFDVASLYPSLLLAIGRNPQTDTLGVFIPLLTSLREYRLRYKQLARTAATEELRSEYGARQANFKILINSFYGYLGFSGARFGDGVLAAEVTRRGRELMQALIDAFTREGCTLLEADTDGLYVASERYFAEPAALLGRVATVLPPGIELEHDGSYVAMFCYKAKNYALYDGRRVTVRGSALRSRGTEPFLKKLGDQLIRYLLGVEPQSPLARWTAMRAEIAERRMPVSELAKGENLSMNPDAYERFVAEGGKPRRASAEAALQLTPRPRMGDRVRYYIQPKAPGRISDWQRARPLALFDPVAAPYDVTTYLEKLDDWLDRYGPFLGVKPPSEQGELSF